MRPQEPNAAFTDLELLVGKWNMVGTHPAFPSAVKGQSSFSWLEHEALLIWHFNWERPGPPNAVSVIGHDDESTGYSMLYSDERGVARIYEVSVRERIWTMQRMSPGFSQRITGTFSEDGKVITARGELSRDGSTWEPDLAIIYTKES